MRIEKVNVSEYVYILLFFRNYCNGCVIRGYNGTRFFHYVIFVSVSQCYEDTRQYFAYEIPY